MSAYQRLVEREGAPPPPGTKICLLQAPLPMGTARAADVAEAAHLGLLRSESAALPSELLTYHAPVPRGDAWQAVMVDDNVILGRRRRRRRKKETRARDAELVDLSFRAHTSAGLAPEPSKTRLFDKCGDALTRLEPR